MGRYFVYILASYTRVLYVGVTNNLERRVYEHKNKLIEGYTQRYDVHRLVYYEETVDVKSALEREKQLKCCRREKKLHLIESMNADWQDLSESWQGSDSAGWSQ